MRVGVFHPGAQNAWQRAVAFQDAGQLAWYATSAYFHPDSAPVRAAGHLPPGLREPARHRLLRRHFPMLDPAYVRRMGVAELAELGLRRLGADALAHPVNTWGNRRFGRQVIALMQREPVDVVWGFDTAALEVFRWAKARGITCVLDQTIGHPAAMNAVMADERARHPEFVRGHDRPFSPAWIARQDEEIALADLVLCGSDFCAETLYAHGCDPAKLRVVPYGYDETRWPGTPPERPPLDNRPLELLFAGTIGPRKGAAHLLRAIEHVLPETARLTLVGHRNIPRRTLDRYRHRVRHVPQVPPGELPALFRGADLLVLPSLFEGSALVLNEALGAGLGIVQSHAAGDGAREGRTGTILPEVSPAALAETIAALARDPDTVAAWQANAWAERPTRTWARYRARLSGVLAA